MTEHIAGVLRNLTSPASADTIDELALLNEAGLEDQAPVFQRGSKSTIGTGATLALFDSIPATLSPTQADAWLAPRLHASLRLTRREASQRGIWWHLAGVDLRNYVLWRWAGEDRHVAQDRWAGPIHKQAIARLWWGAELLRNGADYSSVDDFFSNQDLPNSYLHRPFMRMRPIALGVLESLHEAAGGKAPTSTQINKVASMVNLTIAARSMDAATSEYRPSIGRYMEWVDGAPDEFDPAVHPTGPDDGFVPDELLAVGQRLGLEICELAGVTA